MDSSNPSFADHFCEQHCLSPDSFERKVLAQTLHAPTRWVAVVCMTVSERAFEADRELIKACGRQHRLRMLEEELRDFHRDRRNRGWWRGWLRQRVSTRKLHQIYCQTMLHEQAGGTSPSFRRSRR